MKSLDAWLTEYSQSHQNPTNQWIHRICVPIILWSMAGFLSLLRWPAYSNNIWLSGAGVTSAFTLVFYLRLGFQAFLQMLAILALCLFTCSLLEKHQAHPAAWYLTLFILAWIGQAIGHLYEGKKPSFFKDLQFLLIGPLWILKKH
ncbi:MAG: Mpo1 family 2-hydroxy fatty acid dioxygenase [Bdellovibrionota bacterium]